MDRFKEIFSLDNLKSEIGPLPVWAWGLVLGLVVVFVYYVFLRGKGGDDAAPLGSVEAKNFSQADQDAAANDALSSAFDDLYTELSKTPTAAPDTTVPATTGNTSASGGYGGGYTSAYSAPVQQIAPASINPQYSLPVSVGTIGGKTGYTPPVTNIPSVPKTSGFGSWRMAQEALGGQVEQTRLSGNPISAGIQYVVGTAWNSLTYGTQAILGNVKNPLDITGFQTAPKPVEPKTVLRDTYGMGVTQGNVTVYGQNTAIPATTPAETQGARLAGQAAAYVAPKPAPKPTPKPAPKPAPTPTPPRVIIGSGPKAF